MLIMGSSGGTRSAPGLADRLEQLDADLIGPVGGLVFSIGFCLLLAQRAVRRRALHHLSRTRGGEAAPAFLVKWGSNCGAACRQLVGWSG